MGDIEKFVRSIPKVELHCHLKGSIRRDTLVDLVRRERAPVTEDDIAAFFVQGAQAPGVLDLLRTLDRHLIRRPDDLHRLTVEYLEDAAAHRVRYAEFFWNPARTVRESGIPYPAALAAIVRGIRDAEARFGIVGRVVPSVERDATPAEALQMVGWVCDSRADEVVGIGLDYRAEHHAPELYADAVRAARRAGLRCTAQAGDAGLPWTQVEAAVDRLGVDRVGHGYAVLDAPALAARCAERGLVFTVVPTHRPLRGSAGNGRPHPIRRMAALGLRVHPNTDDPALHRVTPTGAWLTLAQDCGFGLDELRGCLVNGLDGAWIDEATRTRWRREWTAEFDALRASA
jgi:adenine deaminase